MKRFILMMFILFPFLAAGIGSPGGGLVFAQEEEAETAGPEIRVVRVADVINPVVAGFISEELISANRENARAFMIELDTPGGLDTAMRSIIQDILASRIPVIVFVYPPGARAASAGALITLAADFAVMAPGTNIGAAHPVAIGPGAPGEEDENGPSVMMDKVVRDAVAYARSLAEQRGRDADWAESIVRESVSTPASEALKLGVIDLIAENETKMLAGLDGRTYMRDGQPLVLRTEGARLVYAEMNWRQKILNTISNPNIAYLLLMLGILGIFFEISNPGAIFPGAVGVIAILLAFLGLQFLPINYVGVLLIIVALILFILEISVASYGMLTIGGIASLTLGSLMLIDTSEPYLQISRAVIFGTVAVSTAFFLFVLYFVIRAQKSHYFGGREGLVGERGTAMTDISETGRVFVHSEIWGAFSRELIAKGEPVEVVRIAENMKLEVKRVEK
jgi:membrane-bound serine protease (ClpP class)